MSANDSMKKSVVQDMEVLKINGENLYLDKDGNVVRRERRDKKKLFSNAKEKVKQKEIELAALRSAQLKQND